MQKHHKAKKIKATEPQLCSALHLQAGVGGNVSGTGVVVWNVIYPSDLEGSNSLQERDFIHHCH